MTSLQTLDDYGPKFQTKVISTLLTHKKFLGTVFGGLSEKYFSNPSQQWIVGEVIKYYQNYNCPPTMEVLKIELKKIENNVLKLSVKEELGKAYEASDEDLEYIQEEFSKFCKNQSIKRAIMQSVDLLKSGDFEEIKGLISDSIKVGDDIDIGQEYEKDIEYRYRENSRKVIPFPWPAFNDITQGGYGVGDLVLLFGSPKGGKSWLTIAMCGYAALLGYNVIYYSLELGEDYVGKRFDAFFSGVPVDKLEMHREKVQAAINKVKGKIIIKEYAPKKVTLAQMESHLDHLEDSLDFKADVIGIDYLDLFRNSRNRSERKDDIDDIYTEAKGIAKERQVPILSPAQANRSGANKVILEGEHAAGSYDKLMIADILISLARNKVDKVKGVGRFHFMGNRYGEDGVTYNARIDTSTGRIEVDEEQIDPEDLEGPSQEEFQNAEKQTRKKIFNDVFQNGGESEFFK